MLTIDSEYIATLKRVYYVSVKNEALGKLELNVYEHYPFKDFIDEWSDTKYLICVYCECAYTQAKSLKTLTKKLNALGFDVKRSDFKRG